MNARPNGPSPAPQLWTYRTWHIRNGEPVEGIEEQIVAVDQRTANRIAWARAAKHLILDDGIATGTIRMDFVRHEGPAVFATANTTNQEN